MILLLQRKQKSKFRKPSIKLHLTKYTYQSIKVKGEKLGVTINLKAQNQLAQDVKMAVTTTQAYRNVFVKTNEQTRIDRYLK